MSEPIDPASLQMILAPFDGAPCGEDLRLDITPRALYSAIRDARSEARANERVADNDPASGPAGTEGWRTVERLAVEALVSRSKDIEVTCWLVEGLTRRRGLAGLAEGTEVLTGLISRFWNDGVFPSLDPEDPEGRLVALGGLSGQDRDGTLLQPLRRTELFVREDGSSVTVWQYQRSRELAGLGPQTKETRATAGVAPFADIEVCAKGHGRASLVAIGRQATRAAAAWRLLEETMAGVVPQDALPATRRVRNLLDEITQIVERYVPQAELAAVPDPVEPGDAPVETGPADGRSTRVPRSRDAMLDDVLQIAVAFRNNEPNSPFSYTLEEAVRRARLSWPELLREVMPELPSRASVLSGLGIRPPAE